MSTLHPASPEVAHVFHLPFQDIVSPERVRPHLFRGVTPYWVVDVTDIVTDTAAANGTAVRWAPETGVDEIMMGGERHGRLEVWGLTGWYLNVLMRALGAYE
jgi:hypothetical protein